ncbi:hypothetical protein [Micromonospora gifhornensis]|nr:hypothetical protein [Micromonospora gifhornensis]
MRGLRMYLRRLEGTGVPTDHDHLLDAAREPRPTAGPSDSPDPVAGLLRAAAGPPRPAELVGEEKALAAFRAARQAGLTAPPSRPTRRRRFTAGVVVWIAGVAATATAGAALAAVRLDWPHERSAPPSTPITRPVAPSPSAAGGQPDRGGGTPSQGVPGAAPTASPGVTPGVSAEPTEGAPDPTTSASPTPEPPQQREPAVDRTVQAGPGNSDNTADRPGLCKAYLSKPERQREKALRTPAFSELVVAAGGADNVLAYCQAVLAETDPEWLARHGPAAGSTDAAGLLPAALRRISP